MIICRIPYNAEHPRKVAKQTGGVWNAAEKVWVFESAQSENDISPKLRGYIVEQIQNQEALPGLDIKTKSSNNKNSHDTESGFWNWFLNSGE